MAASLLLNAGWILSVQAGLLVLSVLVIAALLAALAFGFRICLRSRSGNWVESVVVDGVVVFDNAS